MSVSNKKSRLTALFMGVRQGSVLAPLLFFPWAPGVHRWRSLDKFKLNDNKIITPKHNHAKLVSLKLSIKVGQSTIEPRNLLRNLEAMVPQVSNVVRGMYTHIRFIIILTKQHAQHGHMHSSPQDFTTTMHYWPGYPKGHIGSTPEGSEYS